MSNTGNSNAVKHGLYSEMILLPGEDRQEFKALYDALREEWDPQGPTQEDKVLNLAQNMWRKHRSNRYRREMAAFGERQLQSEDKEINRLIDFLEDAEAGKPIWSLSCPQNGKIIATKICRARTMTAMMRGSKRSDILSVTCWTN